MTFTAVVLMQSRVLYRYKAIDTPYGIVAVERRVKEGRGI